MNYLYNGVELPPISELPGWNRDTHPYVHMTHYGLDNILGEVMVFLTSKPMVYYPDDKYSKLKANDRGSFEWVSIIGNPMLSDGSHDVNRWTPWKHGTADADDGNSSTAFWSNHDILNEDGSVYLAASDPIPLSTFTPDLISMTMGWLVGRRIAGQRK